MVGNKSLRPISDRKVQKELSSMTLEADAWRIGLVDMAQDIEGPYSDWRIVVVVDALPYNIVVDDRGWGNYAEAQAEAMELATRLGGTIPAGKLH